MKKPTRKSVFAYKKNKAPAINRFSIQRLSPFLLLTVFLVLSFFYMIAAKAGTPVKIISVPFLAANIIFTDFALWNYFEGKKKGIIWALESFISAVIVYWIV
ncbi:MAG TPA: hypothetical protein VGI61_14000 [Parafilimonas sp.]|jgi:hypothetical protein